MVKFSAVALVAMAKATNSMASQEHGSSVLKVCKKDNPHESRILCFELLRFWHLFDRPHIIFPHRMYEPSWEKQLVMMSNVIYNRFQVPIFLRFVAFMNAWTRVWHLKNAYNTSKKFLERTWMDMKSQTCKSRFLPQELPSQFQKHTGW